MSIEKSIGWTDMTCNPIKGRCNGGCWYCYYSGKRGIMDRFNHDSKIRIECNCLMNLPKTPKKTFLCSTHDLFGHWIPKGWKDTIFRWIEKYPQHTFQILTKFPQNIDRPMPDNVWLGVTITGIIDYPKLSILSRAKAKIKFISFEPLLERDESPLPSHLSKWVDWIIVGRLTGYGHKYDPNKKQLLKFKRFGRHFNVPIFLKNNLKEIWGEPLIQEMP